MARGSKRQIMSWALLIIAGIALGYVGARVSFSLRMLSLKLLGQAEYCSWTAVFRVEAEMSRIYDSAEAWRSRLTVEEFFEPLQIELISYPSNSFWIRRHGERMGGEATLAYLLAEQEWIDDHIAEPVIEEGDYVIDCGAHVGVFTRKALDAGAQVVVAVEPDPTQLECLRRNFADEIGEDRVFVVPKAVWSEAGEMELSSGVGNSGESSLVMDEGGEKVRVAVTTIDAIVSELQLPQVDFVKLDIEGAEREALKGAVDTIRRFRPTILMDAYHRVDDMRVVPTLLADISPGYGVRLGPCELRGGSTTVLVPHFAVFDAGQPVVRQPVTGKASSEP